LRLVVQKVWRLGRRRVVEPSMSRTAAPKVTAWSAMLKAPAMRLEARAVTERVPSRSARNVLLVTLQVGMAVKALRLMAPPGSGAFFTLPRMK
jgi:hypothetical protein